MKHNDQIAQTHKGMLLCLWNAVAINNASVIKTDSNMGSIKMVTTSDPKVTDAIKKVIDKIVSMPDYTFEVGQANRLKIDNETHLGVYYKKIYYKGNRLFTIYLSKTTNQKCLIDANTPFLMTDDERAEMKYFDENVDKFLQSIMLTQNKLIEN